MNGLNTFEDVLLYLGVILFFVILFAFVLKIYRKEEVKSLLYFFIIPVVMIGYPAIQKVKYDKLEIELNKSVEELEENPEEITVQKKFKEDIENLDPARFKSNPKLLFNLAKGAFKQQKYEKALEFINEYIELGPEYKRKGMPLKKDIERKMQSS